MRHDPAVAQFEVLCRSVSLSGAENLRPVYEYVTQIASQGVNVGCVLTRGHRLTCLPLCDSLH
jgi:hypothetical protein